MAFNCYACITFCRLSGLVYTRTHARTHARAGVNSCKRLNFCPINSFTVRYTLIHSVHLFACLLKLYFIRFVVSSINQSINLHLFTQFFSPSIRFIIHSFDRQKIENPGKILA